MKRSHPDLEEKENEDDSAALIWQFFEQMQDENAGVCLECQLPVYAKSNDMSYLVDHLRNTHTQIYESYVDLMEQISKRRVTLFRHTMVKKRAAIWNYFDRTDDPMLHSCKACSLSLSGKAKYSANLVKHLKVAHQKLYVQYQKDCGMDDERIKENLDRKLKKRGPKPKYEPTDESHKTCPVCLKLFSSRKNMLAHERAVHSGAKPFVCDECGMSFARKESLTRHSHSTDRPFLCTFCGKTFAKKHIRDIHEKGHYEEKRYNCDYCTKKFSSNQKKKIHERIHTGDKPYECSVCAKKFVQNHQLQTHMRIHTGDKPHACEYCNQSFRHLSTKAKHNCPAKPTVIQQAMIIEEPVQVQVQQVQQVQVQQVQVQSVQGVPAGTVQVVSGGSHGLQGLPAGVQVVSSESIQGLPAGVQVVTSEGQELQGLPPGLQIVTSSDGQATIQGLPPGVQVVTSGGEELQGLPAGMQVVTSGGVEAFHGIPGVQTIQVVQEMPQQQHQTQQ